MLTIRMPVHVARFMYSVIEHLVAGNLPSFKPRLTQNQKAELLDFFDTLAFEISTAAPRPRR